MNVLFKGWLATTMSFPWILSTQDDQGPQALGCSLGGKRQKDTLQPRLHAGAHVPTGVAATASTTHGSVCSLAAILPCVVSEGRQHSSICTNLHPQSGNLCPHARRYGQTGARAHAEQALPQCELRSGTYFYAGVRVGEARHSGPPSPQRSRALDALANVGLARPALHPTTLPEETAFHDCFEETAVSGMPPPSVVDTDEEEMTDAGRNLRAVTPGFTCRSCCTRRAVQRLARPTNGSGAVMGARAGASANALASTSQNTMMHLVAAVQAVALADGPPGHEPFAVLDAFERLPPKSLLAVSQAVLVDDRNYMPAVAPSALIQAFGGLRVASEAVRQSLTAVPLHNTATPFLSQANIAAWMTKMRIAALHCPQAKLARLVSKTVSPVTREGEARPGADRVAGHSVSAAATRKRAGYIPGTGGSSPVQARRGGCGGGRAI